MTIRILLLGLTLLFFILGCGGKKEFVAPEISSVIDTKDNHKKINDALIKASINQGVRPDDDYVIGPEDLLEIDVFQAEELKRKVRVSSQGYIGLPLIGQIKAKGLTPSELEKEIASRLDRYMEEPLVSVYVAEYKARKIAVIGAVTSPQVYSVSGQKYLLDMLSMAGGLTKDAGDICYVIRPLDNERSVSQTETIVIDLKELLIKGNVALNIPVFNGDVINVPKGGMVFVDGAVERPGAFPLQQNTTLVQSIAMAGGFKFEADKNNINVFRDRGDGTREIITIDYEKISKGQMNDFPINDNDIIIVPKSGMKNFFSGFLNAIKGLISFGKAL